MGEVEKQWHTLESYNIFVYNLLNVVGRTQNHQLEELVELLYNSVTKSKA